MKKLLIAIFIGLFGLFAINVRAVHAHMDSTANNENFTDEDINENESHEESVEAVLSDLLTKQQVSTVQELNCDQVSDEDLERLGDAIMEKQHLGEAHHAMDQMMGGEGSDSLKFMHINMGSAYLGCTNNYSQGMMGMMGMMGGAGMTGGAAGGMMPLRFINQSAGSQMANSGMMGGFPMMGFAGGMMSGYGILAGLTWIALVLFLLTGVYFFLKQASKK